MKFRGGYNVPLAGRPAGEVEALPEPEALSLPLRSRRLNLADVLVADGQEVRQGETLASDPAHGGAPLLSPRAGTVRLGEGLIVLEGLAQQPEQPYTNNDQGPHAAHTAGSAQGRRQMLLELGAWQFFADAHTGEVPDLTREPRAVIVSTVDLEPFAARGDVQLTKRLAAFTRGLEHIQSLLEYQPIYLVVPESESILADEIHQTVHGHAYVKVVRIPRKYPFDHPALVARHLGLARGEEGCVWATGVPGVLAVDRAMTRSLPCTARIVAVGGPGLDRPTHVRAMVGYPIAKILEFCGAGEDVRVLVGGALTGETLPAEQVGLDAECTSLTVLPDSAPRELLDFGRPGWGQQSYHGGFLSALRGPFTERLTTHLRGERRACVACGACERVCPAGLWPHLIHKYLYQDALEEAEAARIDLCVECGLCSYVCPSKIELLDQFVAAKKAIRAELAAAAEEAEDEAREVTA